MAEITVSAVGRVTVEPDEVVVSLGLQVDSDRAATALGETSRLASLLAATLTEGGVPVEHRRTSQLSVHPVRVHPTGIEMYQASYMMTVKVRDMESASALIAETAEVLGDNFQIQGLSFGLRNPAPATATARTIAVSEAAAHARQIADAAGLQLGPIRSIVEHPTPGRSGRFQPSFGPEIRAAAASPAGPPLAGGQHEITVAVEVVYETLV